MNWLIRISKAVILLLLIVICVYQFDFIKRQIASNNHRIDIPDYFANISLDEPESIFVLGAFNSSVTRGEIPSDQLKQFYASINGEQIVLNEKPLGTISDIHGPEPTDFAIIFRDKAMDLNGMNLKHNEENGSYLVEIRSSRE